MARGEEKIGVAIDLGIGEIAAALLEAPDERLLFLARDGVRAAAIARAAFEAAGDILVLLLPGSDALPGDEAPASPQVAGQRTAALRTLREGVAAGRRIRLISSGEAAGRLLAPPEAYDASPPSVKVGDAIDLEGFKVATLALGYVEDERVDEPGEVAVLGAVADIFPGDRDMPCRVEVEADGDQSRIIGIRSYDPLTQLTVDELDRLLVGTVAEPTVKAEEGVTLLDHLPGGALALDEGADKRRTRFLALAADAARRLPRRALADICSEARWASAIAKRPLVDLATASTEPAPRFIERRAPDRAFLRYAQAALAEGRKLVLLGSPRDLRFLLSRGARALKRDIVEVACWNEVAVAPAGSLLALPMTVPRGFVRGDTVAVAAADLIGSRAQQKAGGPAATSLAAFAGGDIRIGDVVVDEDHGRAVVAGLAPGPEGSCEAIALRFAGGARRLVPVAEAGRLWRYGSDEGAVSLDRLDGSTWAKRRGEVMAAVAETARGLVQLADARAGVEATALDPDPARFEQLAGSFPWTETPDQLRALTAIRNDLASGRPMDRLVVGDVGYGKTEIALRAAAQAVFAGHQVALAAPTTVLARQHLDTFRSRFDALGVEVALLSRTVTAAERKRVLAGLADGSIAMVVGTGAVAGKGVDYRRLGLVIIDEEQRFGAKDKEKLRCLGSPHALSLTATPIPRTLAAALVGLQPMSVLATPPARRQPIRTEVGAFDLDKLRTALLRERARGGQSFVVVPRIADMAPLRSELARLVPELVVVEAHGKLAAAQIDEVMVGFAAGEGDILLATNIIEAGLDVPRANTMIVINADRFGLAQLHQLRGRVGRGARRGTIHLTTAGDAHIAPRTLARLNLLAAHDRFGAGFAISAGDLDQRGAGDLLGEEQTGHGKLIGIDLYQHLLGLALREARGETVADWLPQLNLGLAGCLPAEWLPDEDVRLSLYLRLVRLDGPGALEAFESELEDRFGTVPPEAEALLALARIAGLAKLARITRIDAGPAAIALTPERPGGVPPAKLEAKNGRWLMRDPSPDPELRAAQLLDILAELAGDTPD